MAFKIYIQKNDIKMTIRRMTLKYIKKNTIEYDIQKYSI